MTVPLATLRRNSSFVWVHERFGSMRGALSPSPMPCLPQAVVAPAVAPAPPLELSSVPVVVEPPPLLPLVEEVQIEGAEVLPEITQTMEQIDLSMENIELTGASLQPAPTKIPLIAPAMQGASSSITSTLDDL